MEKFNKNIVYDFEPISRRIYFTPKRNIYDVITKTGIQIRSLCGGKGTCGKCKILIQKGLKYFNAPTNSERLLLSNIDLEKKWRLACQTKVISEFIEEIEEKPKPQIRIFLPDELLLEDFEILTTGTNKGVNLNPTIKKVYLEVEKPTLENPISDVERINSSYQKKSQTLNLDKHLIFNFSVLNQLPLILRKNDHKITLTIMDEKEVLSCEPGNTVDNNYGIAFDIGTTTLVGYLMNLNYGKIYAVSSKLNPQTAYGEDLVTRITYIKENEDGLEKLNKLILDALNEIISKTCLTADINPSQIYEATIVGNSVMHHIFLRLDPINIGLSPYVPIIQSGLNIKSKEISLNISNQGNVYTLPLIAGFVGADTMGVIIASEIEKESELTLVIDIGTNGEIIIGNKEIIATGSCAAGSALEGAHIKDGMRAAAGSIDKIKINPDTLEVSYGTIRNKQPIGICGSGLIDAVAEMLKSKIITRSGNFNKNLLHHKRFINKEKNKEFIIAHRNETVLGRNITISQNDIRQIQMAKAAFYSGSRIILTYLNDLIENQNYEIKKIFLAGAFGNYIDKENAKFIGMIPDIPNENIYQIGNAAGIGAQYCLLNKDLRDKANNLLKKIKYVEIAVKNEFQREYAEAMYFPHLDLNKFPTLKIYDAIPKR